MDAYLFLQQFGYLAQGEGGIKKLGELVVHQAVGGKFTTDPKNEWITKPLGKIAIFEYGKGLPAKARATNGTYPVYGSNGIVGYHDKALIHEPSIVIGRKGSAGALNIANEPFWPTDVTYYSTPPKSIDLHFYFYLLSTLGLDKLGKGIKPGLNRNEAYRIMVSYPPLAEQKRIVAKVDELMAFCDKLKAEQKAQRTLKTHAVQSTLHHLTNAKSPANFGSSLNILERSFGDWFNDLATVKHLRATILQLAVQGKLVPQNPADEPASELLKRIEAEKKRLLKEGKLKLPKPFASINTSDQAYIIPENWQWTQFGVLVQHSEAGWSPKCEEFPRTDDNWGVLKVSAVSWGKFKPEENKALPVNLEPRPEYEVMSGDMLISRANTAELVAKSVVVEDCPPKLMMSDKIIRFKLTLLVDLRFCNLVNTSGASRAYYADVAGGTSASMKNVSREQILSLAFPLPPLAEQKRIVAKVDELMTLCDQLEAHITHTQTINTHLMDSLIYRMTQAA